MSALHHPDLDRPDFDSTGLDSTAPGFEALLADLVRVERLLRDAPPARLVERVLSDPRPVLAPVA